VDRFVVDTCSFIEMDFFNKKIFKSLWENIYAMCDDGTLFSVREVFEELGKGDDNIQEEWGQKDYVFRELFDEEQEALGYLERFEAFQRHGANSSTGLWADPHLIAYTITKNAIVITEENLNNNPERKIPFVCNELGIGCMNFNDFMEYQEWQW